MTGHALSVPRVRPGVPVALSLLAALLVSAAVFAALRPTGEKRPSFTLTVPEGWHTTSPNMIRRDDGRGLVVVRRTAPLRATNAELVRGLGMKLRRRYPGFRVVSARMTSLRGGRAFVYTFVHGTTVQSLALVSVRGQAYAIDSTVPGDARDAAREAGAIVRSFGP